MAETSSYSTVNKILLMQSLVVIVVVLGFFIAGSDAMAMSSLLGGMTAFLPNLYFAYRMSTLKEQSAQEILSSFYKGETRKILMTCVLFAVVFQWFEVQFFPLMACFIAVLSVFWLALIVFAHEFEIKL